MNFFRYDSPLMNFITKVVDLVIINLLWVICCIPIITIGAATTAKYATAMRVVRDEGTGVIKPFFKSFALNFRQATIVELIFLFFVVVLVFDWRWLYFKGFSNVPTSFIIALVILSIFVLACFASVCGLISRFEVTIKNAFKGGIIFALISLIKFAFVFFVEVGTFVACIWYARYLPIISVFGSTCSLYFLCAIFIKQFQKTEANYNNSKDGDAVVADDVTDDIKTDDAEEVISEGASEKNTSEKNTSDVKKEDDKKDKNDKKEGSDEINDK